MKRGFISLAFGSAAWLVSSGLYASVALACPVCFSATEENRNAFLLTTIILSLLPLSMIAGVILWIRSAARERSEQDAPAGVDPTAEAEPGE
ncbi:MAG: hypothetical protein IT378_18785 [Sandaracinaceae bacterium]|nr:hypothetical protein [Sandaracinaceae bacterium]